MLKMFEDLLQSPFEHLPYYTYLLRSLCGKNRYRYANFVFKMLELQRIKVTRDKGFG